MACSPAVPQLRGREEEPSRHVSAAVGLCPGTRPSGRGKRRLVLALDGLSRYHRPAVPAGPAPAALQRLITAHTCD